MKLIDADKMKEYMKNLTSKELMENEEVFEIIDEQPTVKINGNTSDGYHTFDELYHHRAILFAVICNANKDKAIPVDYWMPLPEPPKKGEEDD